MGRVGPSHWIVSKDEGASRAVVGPCDRVSNKGELCVKERQVVFPGGRSIVSRAPVCCCRESEAMTSDRE
jgi:hypothetical protein